MTNYLNSRIGFKFEYVYPIKDLLQLGSGQVPCTENCLQLTDKLGIPSTDRWNRCRFIDTEILNDDISAVNDSDKSLFLKIKE